MTRVCGLKTYLSPATCHPERSEGSAPIGCRSLASLVMTNYGCCFVTKTGVGLATVDTVVVLLPSWPTSLRPMQRTLSLVRRMPHVCEADPPTFTSIHSPAAAAV